jgi:hypothetical protein
VDIPELMDEDYDQMLQMSKPKLAINVSPKEDFHTEKSRGFTQRGDTVNQG